MNSLKSLIIVGVMSVVAYGVYATLTKRAPTDEPLAGSPAPEVQLGTADPSSAATSKGSFAPKFIEGGPPGEAPRFEPVAPEQDQLAAADYSSAVQQRYDSGEGAASPEIAHDHGIHDHAAHASEAFPGGTNVEIPPARQPSDLKSQDQAYGAEAGSASVTDAPGATQASANPQDFATATQEVQGLLEEGRLAEAHLALSLWYGNPQVPAEQLSAFEQLLNQLTGTVVYSRQHLLEPAYQVQPAETLQQIAEKYNVSWQLLAKINGIADPANLPVGEQLKVVRGPFDAVVDMAPYQLTLYLGGHYAGRFALGFGMDRSLPPGEFEVMNKSENPIYTGPDGVIAADDPSNPLGERWIDLGQQIGIHGTNDPQLIGQTGGRGSIRLSAEDIEHVYDILTPGSRVIIRQ